MSAASDHMERVASIGCVVCRKLGYGYTPCEVHHIGEGSSKRNDFLTAGLCREHHQGATGFHTLKERAFCSMYRVPHEREWGLLAWVNEYLAKEVAA